MDAQERNLQSPLRSGNHFQRTGSNAPARTQNSNATRVGTNFRLEKRGKHKPMLFKMGRKQAKTPHTFCHYRQFYANDNYLESNFKRILTTGPSLHGLCPFTAGFFEKLSYFSLNFCGMIANIVYNTRGEVLKYLVCGNVQ